MEDKKNLADVGVNIEIPNTTWLYLAMAILVPALIIIAISHLIKKV